MFIDCYHLDNINWQKVKDEGFIGAFLKVSDGVHIYPDWVKTQLEKMNKLGLKAGAYHWIQPLVVSTKQVDSFLTQIKDHTWDLGFALDVEPTIVSGNDNWKTLKAAGKAQPSTKVKNCIDQIKLTFPSTPLSIYTTNTFWDSLIYAGVQDEVVFKESLAKTRQWVARYPFTNYTPYGPTYHKYLPSTLKGYSTPVWAWQFTEKAPVAGIKECDVNVILP